MQISASMFRQSDTPGRVKSVCLEG